MTRRDLFQRLAGAFVGSSLGAWLGRHTPPAPVPLAFHPDAFALTMADLDDKWYQDPAPDLTKHLYLYQQMTSEAAMRKLRTGEVIRVRIPQRYQTDHV